MLLSARSLWLGIGAASIIGGVTDTSTSSGMDQRESLALVQIGARQCVAVPTDVSRRVGGDGTAVEDGVYVNQPLLYEGDERQPRLDAVRKHDWKGVRDRLEEDIG